MRVLVTGGAGFIGSHLVDGLLERGHEVRVLDSLVPQVHGEGAGWPHYVSSDADLRLGDVRDRDAVAAALDRAEVVFHEAALVGVGQSMYEIRPYCDANVVGTAVLLEEIVKRRDVIQKVVVASSMSNYGEGRYRRSDGALRSPTPRPLPQLEERRWELVDGETGEELESVPTDEAKPLNPTSVYATTKRDQEELVLNVGRAYGIPAVGLRYFNTYGTRQSLSNPYTGVAAIFASRLLNGEPPLIFEDGRQTRDFTHVSDVVRANLLALENSAADGHVFNVGTGTPTTLLELTEKLLDTLGARGRIEPQIVGRFREGDIRHCYADIELARVSLGYEPTTMLEDGIGALAGWVSQQTATDDVAGALKELQQHSLVK